MFVAWTRCSSIIFFVVHVLVAEDVVMHVVLLRRLTGQHECLGEATHWMAIVGQLSRNLHDHTVTERRLSIDIRNLRMAIAEVQLLDLVVDVLLTDDQNFILGWVWV